MAEYVGLVGLFAGSYAPVLPVRYQRCDGQALSRSTYPKLEQVIDDAYGGDSSTFNLPDLNSSLPYPGGTHTSYLVCTDGEYPSSDAPLKESYLVGMVSLFIGKHALPSDFVECDGRLLSINRYEVLYSILGTRFGGNGDQDGTFAVPKLNDPPPFSKAPAVKYYICVEGIYPVRS